MRVLGLVLSVTAVIAQEVDDTAYLLQTRTQQKSGDEEDCYVTGGCSTAAATTTTTEAPTTTTARPTRPTRPATTTPRPTRPTTTTTEAPKPPPIGMHVETVPEGETPDYDDYCGETATATALKLSNPIINNLGGMGPDTRVRPVIRYVHVATVEVDGTPTPVNLEISTDDSYYKANIRERAYGQTGPSFIGKYNSGGSKRGRGGRTDVMAIGSLAKGSFKFTFKFMDDDGIAVVVPHLPMTFFDLDGSTKVDGKSYEELKTNDALSIAYVDGTKVTHSCDNGTCASKGALEEIEIPSDFKHLSAQTRKAAVTFFFKSTSSFDITYTLNWQHRVFLFNGLCIE